MITWDQLRWGQSLETYMPMRRSQPVPTPFGLVIVIDRTASMDGWPRYVIRFESLIANTPSDRVFRSDDPVLINCALVALQRGEEIKWNARWGIGLEGYLAP